MIEVQKIVVLDRFPQWFRLYCKVLVVGRIPEKWAAADIKVYH